MSAVVAAAALAVCVPAQADAGPRRAACEPMSDSALPQERLRDWVSFFDEVTVVQGIAERAVGPLDDPDATGGLVGRSVTARVEQVLWRRSHAPDAPRRLRFTDLGWWQADDGSFTPVRRCGETRLVIGRRYLAVVGHLGRTWFPATTARLRLRGDRVLGGVDRGRPGEGHAALRGLRIQAAVRRIARTRPYRAAVRHAQDGPRARVEAVARDGFR